VKEQIQGILRRHNKRRIVDQDLKAAAVLMPLFFDQGQYHVLFAVRSDQVNHHKGQVCFPGGTREPSDSSLLQTALRETKEEIGLEADEIEVLGELDDSITLTSQYVISPFVAMIRHPYALRTRGDEVKETFSVPLSFLMDEANVRPDQYAFEYKGHTIWGATAGILGRFIDLLRSEGGAP
jgi:8-oxo-dGTP pyrophosphatase MutT (NUDIX family)